MTNEDAKQWIENLIKTMRMETSGPCSDPSYKDEVYVALKTAIKALEQQPCDDCISRQAVLDIIMPYCQDDDGSVENTSDLRNALDDIESLPPVTPKEKTGRWIYKQGIFGAVYCSKCDFELKTNNTKYCPNCGARMVSE